MLFDRIRVAAHLALNCLVIHFDVRYIDQLQVDVFGRNVAKGSVENDGVHNALQHLPHLVLFHILHVHNLFRMNHASD